MSLMGNRGIPMHFTQENITVGLRSDDCCPVSIGDVKDGSPPLAAEALSVPNAGTRTKEHTYQILRTECSA